MFQNMRLNKLNRKQKALVIKAMQIQQLLQEYEVMKKDYVSYLSVCQGKGDPVGQLSIPRIHIS